MSNMARLLLEAKRVSELLGIKCPKLKLVNNLLETNDFILDENGEYKVFVGQELDINGQISHVIRSIRLIWTDQSKIYAPSTEDIICFEIGYRVFLLKELLNFFYSGDSKLDNFINNYIDSIRFHVCFFGIRKKDFFLWAHKARSAQFLSSFENN